ncbi:MAG: MerR family transcriptional regulator [Candidatus Kaelpia imicola]|nr:MerR family transcriptional regulator [Candidatus Kaelpia imicola]
MDKQIYNVPKAAQKLGVHEQTVRYWIKKGWVEPKRDYRNYPVFTDSDIKKIIKWRNTFR